MDHRIIFADVLDGLRSLESESINCVATSPPYWGLRDYGAEGQIGLEETPEAYVARLVEVFAEVRRVLREDGTLWLNLGDSYANQRQSRQWNGELCPGFQGKQCRDNPGYKAAIVPRRAKHCGLKDKDLCGIPWRVAFALQADGWWLRNDIIWAKKNPMPESVTDRFSSTYEHVFLLTKAARYWFDLDAVREPHTTFEKRERGIVYGGKSEATSTFIGEHHPLGKNPGDVWRIATKPTPYAHFATWPPDLVERMILAGCPPKVCKGCGEPWEHRVETVRPAKDAPSYRDPATQSWTQGSAVSRGHSHQGHSGNLPSAQKEDLGYHPACKCQQWSCKSQPGIVLDPFAGSGTTSQVARKLGRRSIGIELNPDYEAVMRERLDLPPGGSLFADEDLGVEFVTLDVAEVTG